VRSKKRATTVFLAHDLLGECPYWNAEQQSLTRVDVHAGNLVACFPETGEQNSRTLGAPLSFAVPRKTGGLVAGVGMRVVLLAQDGSLQPLVDLSSEVSNNRLNDAVCDPLGRLWVGTMSTKTPRSLGKGEAALFRIDPDGSYEKVLAGLTLSNGMDWLNGGRTLLHIDSDQHRIDQYDVELNSGRLTSRSTFVDFEPDIGLPDGMTVDSGDGVWVAFFGGGQVRHYDADGVEDDRIDLPVSCPASVMLGGEDLRDLFITTSSHRLSSTEAAEQPLAGSLFRFRVTGAGRAQHLFAG
jgi:sugar lactone lactonase YvrE